MKNLNNCPICNSTNFKPFIDCKDYSTTKEVFSVVSCSSCKFTFTNPRPKDESLGKYYLSDSYISHTNTSKGLFENLYQIVRKYAIRQKLNLLNQLSNKKIHLDIGCGTGEFLNACKTAAYKVKGIEPSNIAREKAIKNYSLDISENTDLEQFKASSFETISMWHVLEHVPDLNKTIENLKLQNLNYFQNLALEAPLQESTVRSAVDRLNHGQTQTCPLPCRLPSRGRPPWAYPCWPAL